MDAILRGVQGLILEPATETEAPPTHVEVRRVIAAIRVILDGSERLDPLLIQELARTLGMHSVVEEQCDGGWSLIDPSVMNYHVKEDGKLASVDEIHSAVDSGCRSARNRAFREHAMTAPVAVPTGSQTRQVSASPSVADPLRFAELLAAPAVDAP